jgi:transposase InsO family protein
VHDISESTRSSVLEWRRPGAVWAMDHTEPPEPVDGSHRAIFSVRDLASGAQLVWKEEIGPNASEVVRDLEEKFLLHGAPLVLKLDNGSAFIAWERRDLCRSWGVELLWSPPRTPRYNGACEAGIRWLKERTEHVALRSGRPGRWTAEDLRVAEELTNRLPKYAGRNATPRGEVYRARDRIAEGLRAAFRSRLEGERAAERHTRRIAPEQALERREEATIDRQAMRRALVALGILTITTRRVSLTPKSLFRVKIS